MKWCFVTIGQSPRDDLVPELLSIIGRHNFNYTEIGLLDDLSSLEIQEMKPHKGDKVLVSKLRSGEQVILSHEKVEKALNNLTKKESSYDAVFLLCTSEFELLVKKHGNKTVIMPSLILKKFLESFSPFDSLGVVVPESSQIDNAIQRWKEIAKNVSAVHLSPYLDSDKSEWEKASRFFQERKVNYIVMDCMGYSVSHSQKLSELSNLPVFAARVIAGNFLRNFVI